MRLSTARTHSQPAEGEVRANTIDKLLDLNRKASKDAQQRKRDAVVETLLDRAAKALAVRNGLEPLAARARIESADGRAVLESAAWRWGFMEGNALNLFKPSPTAGLLKLPDLSLAIGFEHRLGLTGDSAEARRLVQTARILTLTECAESVRGVKAYVVSGGLPQTAGFVPRSAEKFPHKILTAAT